MGSCCSGPSSQNKPSEINLQKKKADEEDDFVNVATRIHEHHRGVVVRCAPPPDEE